VFALLPEAARLCVEDLMSTGTYREYQSEFVLAVPEAIRDRIRVCTDLERLAAWVRAAGTANTIEDVFG
jgi:hypothetical protein